jgi:hypothetical protein
MSENNPRNAMGYHYNTGPTFDWEAEAKGLLKAELGRRNLRYPDLVKRLATVGVFESAPNLRNKISRGNFSAVFFVQCLMAIGATDLRLNPYPLELDLNANLRPRNS